MDLHRNMFGVDADIIDRATGDHIATVYRLRSQSEEQHAAIARTLAGSYRAVAALEAVEHWLAEEAASPHPGQTRPDEILRTIRDALGKPHDAPDASPSVPQTADDGPEAAPGSIAPLVEFLCVGIYEDDGMRFADTVKAYDAAGAEATAEAHWPRVTWAGFVALRDGVMIVEG
jgi:hypothetical protein